MQQVTVVKLKTEKQTSVRITAVTSYSMMMCPETLQKFVQERFEEHDNEFKLV